MRKDTILFDLDGTLLPLDQGEFTRGYFKGITKCAAPLGYKAEALVSALWKGTGAMVKNDGEKTNRERFWSTFAAVFGEKALEHERVFDEFYRTDFDKVRSVVRPGIDAAATVAAARGKGYGVILATNPIFPLCAMETRLGWIGLSADDFDYVTSYENCRYCKPNPEYYAEIARRAGRQPQQCIMIGNNTRDDMSALKIGMGAFLLTDFLENEDGRDVSDFTSGGAAELNAFIGELPPVE